MTLEKYREVIQASRGCIRKGRAHTDLNLVRDMKDDKRAFAKCISSKRKMKEYTGLLLNKANNK